MVKGEATHAVPLEKALADQVIDVSGLFSALQDVQTETTGKKRAVLTQEPDRALYLPSAITDYKTDEQEKPKDTNILVKQRISDKAFADTNAFDPGNPESAYRAPPATVYAHPTMPVTQEWSDLVARMGRDLPGPYKPQVQQSPFFIQTRKQFDAIAAGLLPC